MGYKYVIAIIRDDLLDALEAELRRLRVRGLTVSRVKGYGEYKNFFSISQLTSRMKVEIFVEESKAETIANAILDVAHSEVEGAGIVAVMPVEGFFHVRTRSATLPDET